MSDRPTLTRQILPTLSKDGGGQGSYKTVRNNTSRINRICTKLHSETTKWKIYLRMNEVCYKSVGIDFEYIN